MRAALAGSGKKYKKCCLLRAASYSLYAIRQTAILRGEIFSSHASGNLFQHDIFMSHERKKSHLKALRPSLHVVCYDIVEGIQESCTTARAPECVSPRHRPNLIGPTVRSPPVAFVAAATDR